jgi:hypothetical protein
MDLQVGIQSRTIFAAVILGFAPACFGAATEANAAPQIKVDPGTGVFWAYGDTRFTHPAKCNISDPNARQALVYRIAASDDKPDFVVVTGDIVYHGDDDNDWRIFEKETKSLRDHKIRLFPVLGNHDVHGNAGRSNFVDHFEELKRYPQLKKTGWYSLDYGNSHFIMLDSQNPYESQTPQGDWLESQLKGVPEDLDFLVVVLHHPLVTHASRALFWARCSGQTPIPATGHDVENAELHLKVTLEKFAKDHSSTKILVLSGHNHNYEHYAERGITYIVTAGGGATPYPINRKPTDFYHDTGPTYHYCRIKIDGHTLTLDMFKLNRTVPEKPKWEIRDSLEMHTQEIKSAIP